MPKVRIKPLGENVLITPEPIEKKTQSGIYLPESASQERRQEGKVIAVGNAKEIPVTKGDLVIFKRYGSSEEVTVDGEEYLIVNYKDVLAVVE